jgi:L-fuculose-phosphate aldolase
MALAMEQEIIRAGKKLWERQYVDGNGGNISVRLSQDYVLCTPSLCSKEIASLPQSHCISIFK